MLVATYHVSTMDFVLLVAFPNTTLVTASLDTQEPTVMRISMTVSAINVSTVLV